MRVGIKAVTFNAFHDYPACRHIEQRLAILEEGLAHEAPDITILQEVSASTLYGHLPQRLVDGLGSHGLRYELFYAPANGSLEEGGAFEEGSAILSRWPIRDVAVRRLAPERPIEREYQGYRYLEYRIAITARIEVERGVLLDVFGAHLTDFTGEETTPYRRLQLEDLERFVAERSAGNLPPLLGGDFNAAPDSPEIRWLRAAGFLDVCALSDPGFTNDPADRDLESAEDTARHRIDYLFVGPGHENSEVHGIRLFLARPKEIEPGRHLWASDHNGILAELSLGRLR